MAQVSNEITIAIRAKGWSLWQFLAHIDRSLSWYRCHARKESHKYEWLVSKVEELEVKHEFCKHNI